MLADIVRASFTAAHRRVGLVFLDVVWKVVWLGLTVAVLILALLWLTADLRAISWDQTGDSAINATAAVLLLREYWNAKQGEIFSALFIVVAISGTAWLFLEALFRRKIVRDVSNTSTLNYPFNVFLASGLFKVFFLVAGILVMAALVSSDAIGLALVMGATFGFFLTLVDSLIRADAVELLGTDLFRVTGLLGILMFLEAMSAGAAGALLLAGLLNVSRALDAVLMLGAAAAGALLLTLVHSYLLLVRFSAIAIMRRNVVEI